jgi:hypothetical protein
MNNKVEVETFLSALSSIGLSEEEIDELGRETGLIQRRGGKISVHTFLAVLFDCSAITAPSFNDLAAGMDACSGIFVSKQAIAKKMTSSCLELLKVILAKVITSKIAISDPSIYKSCNYKRLIIQDSTVIKLPDRLFEAFSGVRNQHTTACNARIQVVYDLLSEQFLYFSIDPYSVNDIKAAPELLLYKGDFTLRDRGYISHDEIERHIAAEADTIYRHQAAYKYLDPSSGKEIDLLKLLKKKGHIDMEVLLNNKSQSRIRLIAAPVDEETANLRRMKIKKESSNKNASEYVLKLQSWTIFITTVKSESVSFEEILSMYGLRWRIEIIFKCWKSNMNFNRLHNISETQLNIILTARMTSAVIINRLIFLPAFIRISQCYNRDLSLMKLTKYLSNNILRIDSIITALNTTQGRQPVLDSLARYCTYDKRKKRLNHAQKVEAVLQLWP